MVVGDDETYAWHTNPSTRPFVQSRKAPLLGDEKDRMDESGAIPPMTSTTTTFDVSEPADLVRATVRTAYPVDGQVVSYAQFHLRLLAPDGTLVAEATEFGPANSGTWTGPTGAGGRHLHPRDQQLPRRHDGVRADRRDPGRAGGPRASTSSGP